MPRPDFGDFLGRSLSVLATEVPAAYGGVAEALGRCSMRVVVDGQPHVMRFSDGRHEISSGRATIEAEADGELRTTSAAILDLTNGRLCLIDALLNEQLFLRGPLDVVVRFDRALGCYLAGAVRAASFPALLDDYRLGVADAAAPTEGETDGRR